MPLKRHIDQTIKRNLPGGAPFKLGGLPPPQTPPGPTFLKFVTPSGEKKLRAPNRPAARKNFPSVVYFEPWRLNLHRPAINLRYTMVSPLRQLSLKTANWNRLHHFWPSFFGRRPLVAMVLTNFCVPRGPRFGGAVRRGPPRHAKID